MTVNRFRCASGCHPRLARDGRWWIIARDGLAMPAPAAGPRQSSATQLQELLPRPQTGCCANHRLVQQTQACPQQTQLVSPTATAATPRKQLRQRCGRPNQQRKRWPGCRNAPPPRERRRGAESGKMQRRSAELEATQKERSSQPDGARRNGPRAPCRTSAMPAARSGDVSQRPLSSTTRNSQREEQKAVAARPNPFWQIAREGRSADEENGQSAAR